MATHLSQLTYENHNCRQVIAKFEFDIKWAEPHNASRYAGVLPCVTIYKMHKTMQVSHLNRAVQSHFDAMNVSDIICDGSHTVSVYPF